MAKKKRRARNATRGRANDQAHAAGSSKSFNNTKATKTRTKANDLKYNPKKWESQKYIILNHFESSMCGSILDGTIVEPEVNPEFATALLTDESRSGKSPTPPSSIDPVYWACPSHEELALIAFAREGVTAFHSLSIDDKSVKREATPQEAKSGTVIDEPAEANTNEHTAKAWELLSKYQADLAKYRSANPLDFVKHQKLMSYINSSLDSATGTQEYMHFPVHIQHKIYAELNTKIYSFLNQYIGREYKYLKSDVTHGDGLSLFKRCNIKQSKPSAASGQAVLKRLIGAKQRHGQEYSAYYQFVQDVCDEYEEATGGLEPDENLVRLALTERISDFYKPVIDSIKTNDLTQGITTPLVGKGSISDAMTQYEIDNQEAFRQFCKKKSSRTQERANSAQRQQNDNRNPKREDRKCDWCSKYIPRISTTHNTKDCRIKKDYVDKVCEVCGQKGHPARLCTDGKKGRANQADEDNRSVDTSRSSKTRVLTRHQEPPADELNSAEAIKLIKASHKRGKKSGRRRRYKVVEVHDDTDTDDS